MEPVVKENNQTVQVGKRIREWRKKRGFTLEDLGSRIDRSPAYLSQIERGQVNINISILDVIARELGIPLFDFFANEKSPDIGIIRKSEQQWYRIGNVASESPLIKTKSELEAFLIRLPPGSDTLKDSVHQGEEFCFVLRGAALVLLNSTDKYKLNKGDGMHFISDIPHMYQNLDNEIAEILVINTPATY